MVDNKESFIEAAIFQATDGTKYAINPFATRDLKTFNESTKSENNEEKLVTRESCDTSFESEEVLEHHNVETYDQNKLITCNLCKASFRRRENLKRHVQSVHKNQTCFVCPVCNKDCKKKETLQNHLKKKHPSPTEVFNCSECDFTCNTLAVLQKHECKHTAADRHVCPHCNTTFKRRDHMVRHVKTQHLNQIVVCPICNRIYKRKDHVVRHVREKHNMGLYKGKLMSPSEMMQVTYE